MAQASEVPSMNGGSIRVGTTGTIGSLMTRELESIKPLQTSDPSRKKPQSAPVSVPCGATPRKSQPIRNTPNEVVHGNGSSSSKHENPGDEQKARHMPRKNGHRFQILDSDTTATDRKEKREKTVKKGSAYIVEVVDLKCSNPMSSRFKKLGFSKLSDSAV